MFALKEASGFEEKTAPENQIHRFPYCRYLTFSVKDIFVEKGACTHMSGFCRIWNWKRMLVNHELGYEEFTYS